MGRTTKSDTETIITYRLHNVGGETLCKATNCTMYFFEWQINKFYSHTTNIFSVFTAFNVINTLTLLI
jgi:hypothetical protein